MQKAQKSYTRQNLLLIVSWGLCATPAPGATVETSVHLSRDGLCTITRSPLIHTGGIIPDRPLHTLLLLLTTHAEPCSFYTLGPCPRL